MKRANRTTIIVNKYIGGKSWDMFRIVIPTDRLSDIRKEYENRGYVVFNKVSFAKYCPF